MAECEEFGCDSPATREWHGKKVCSDHYDMYREQEEKLRRELYY